MDVKVEQRSLGSQGLKVSAQGLGTMGMTAFYAGEQISEEEKLKTIGTALEIGINFIDTAWIYQNHKTGETNEALVGKALKMYGREKFVLATKFGIGFVDGKEFICGKSDYIREQLKQSLERLDTNYIDLYYQHRMDPSTPIEETMACLLELQKEGKIRYVGLSECTSEEIERAHKVMPLSAIQMEWSLQSRELEKSVLGTARKLGIGIVAYSPLGRGLLSMTFTKKEDLKDDDFRKHLPRFNDENFEKNIQKVKLLEEYAKKKGLTITQLALAWVHNQGKDVFPIPGTKSSKRIAENAKGALVVLDPKEMKEIEDIVGEVQGNRYGESFMKSTSEGRAK